jgi:hypothetical protein
LVLASELADVGGRRLERVSRGGGPRQDIAQPRAKLVLQLGKPGDVWQGMGIPENLGVELEVSAAWLAQKPLVVQN